MSVSSHSGGSVAVLHMLRESRDYGKLHMNSGAVVAL